MKNDSLTKQTSESGGRNKTKITKKKVVGRRAGHYNFDMMEWTAIDRLAM